MFRLRRANVRCLRELWINWPDNQPQATARRKACWSLPRRWSHRRVSRTATCAASRAWPRPPAATCQVCALTWRCLLYLAQCEPESLGGVRHVPLAWPLTRRCNGDLVPSAEVRGAPQVHLRCTSGAPQVHLASLPDNWQQGKAPAGGTRDQGSLHLAGPLCALQVV